MAVVIYSENNNIMIRLKLRLKLEESPHDMTVMFESEQHYVG